MIKFEREEVKKILQVGEKIEITISGKLTDGIVFEGGDRIRVIFPS
jgi:20S proteasome alpha/beta subunit